MMVYTSNELDVCLLRLRKPQSTCVGGANLQRKLSQSDYLRQLSFSLRIKPKQPSSEKERKQRTQIFIFKIFFQKQICKQTSHNGKIIDQHPGYSCDFRCSSWGELCTVGERNSRKNEHMRRRIWWVSESGGLFFNRLWRVNLLQLRLASAMRLLDCDSLHK